MRRWSLVMPFGAASVVLVLSLTGCGTLGRIPKPVRARPGQGSRDGRVVSIAVSATQQVGRLARTGGGGS